MRVVLIFILLAFPFLMYGQNRYLSLGCKDNGLCFGNSNSYNGIRFNLIDKEVDCLNGLNTSLISRYFKTNGLKFSFQSDSKITNGINFSVWGLSDSISNGLTFATGANCYKINGVGIGLLGFVADTMNGFFFTGLIGTSNWSTDPINIVNGVVFGAVYGVNSKELNGLAIGINNRTEKQNGVVIGIINETNELRGFQFGLWNIAKNNRFLKSLPIMNFNLREKASR
jgi:hypothetical protein